MAQLSWKQRRKQFVRLVTRILLEAQAGVLEQRSPPQVIHPGGVLAAIRHVEMLLQRSNPQF